MYWNFTEITSRKSFVFDEAVQYLGKESCPAIMMENIAPTLDNLHISQYKDENKTEEEELREIVTKKLELIL